MPHEILEPPYLKILEDDWSPSEGCPPRQMIPVGIMLSKIYRDDNERWLTNVRAGRIEYNLNEAVERYRTMRRWIQASSKWLQAVEADVDTVQLFDDTRELRAYVDEADALLVDPREAPKVVSIQTSEEGLSLGFLPGGHEFSPHQS